MPEMYVITAAGGNPTAIQLIAASHTREWYEEEGGELMRRTHEFGVEQAGFLDLERNHFEMSGGEFCGNAARSAAMIIAWYAGEGNFTFTMSGYEGPVHGEVRFSNAEEADVTCIFPNLRTNAQDVMLRDGRAAKIVDLGGIVHVILEGEFPADYEDQHCRITAELGLTDRAAVGVNWTSLTGDRATLHPVVWVKSINTFFYETACGSGSIAAAAATGRQDIVQPTGQSILVEIAPDGVHLTSHMEVSRAE